MGVLPTASVTVVTATFTVNATSPGCRSDRTINVKVVTLVYVNTQMVTVFIDFMKC